MVFTLSASDILVYNMMCYNNKRTAATLYSSCRLETWNAPTALFTIASR